MRFIINIKPLHQPDGQALKKAFSNAIVRLTHYVRLSQLNLINAANVRKAFLRGMGLAGAHSQKLFDILIPMLFVDPKKSPSAWVVEQGSMSQIMANWKNQAADADATPPHSDPFNTYKNLNSDQPTILMWHQFGSKKSKVDLPQTTQAHHTQKANVYFIDLYGIGPGGVTETNRAEYQQVVGCEDMYRDAPYTFPEYISEVERTLPRWSADSFQQTAG